MRILKTFAQSRGTDAFWELKWESFDLKAASVNVVLKGKASAATSLILTVAAAMLM